MPSMEERIWDIKPVPIPFTRQYIREHIHKLRSAGDLAGAMGYSRSYFSVCVKKHFNKTVRELLQEERLRRIKIEIQKHPHETSRSIAKRVGLKDEKQMYKFLFSSPLKTNFTALRNELLFGQE